MRNLVVEADYRGVLNRHRELLREWYAHNDATLDAKYMVRETK
jgi:hypothetical protein